MAHQVDNYQPSGIMTKTVVKSWLKKTGIFSRYEWHEDMRSALIDTIMPLITQIHHNHQLTSGCFNLDHVDRCHYGVVMYIEVMSKLYTFMGETIPIKRIDVNGAITKGSMMIRTLEENNEAVVSALSWSLVRSVTDDFINHGKWLFGKLGESHMVVDVSMHGPADPISVPWPISLKHYRAVCMRDHVYVVDWEAAILNIKTKKRYARYCGMVTREVKVIDNIIKSYIS